MDIRRQHIALTITLIAVIAIVLRPEFLSDTFMLIFLGVIPGTSMTLPSWVTVLIFVVALVFAVRWLFDQPVYRPVATSKDLSRRADARRRVMKQTTPSRKQAAHRPRKQPVKA